MDAIAARTADGKLLVAVTNLDPENPATIDARIGGMSAKTATAETLTAPAVDSINTFDSQNAVVPKQLAVKLQNGGLSATVQPRSVTVIEVS